MKRGGARPSGTRKKQACVPVITFHRDRDATVRETNSQEIVAAATAAAGTSRSRVEKRRSASGRAFTRARSVDAIGDVPIEQWTVGNSGHAWAGGSPTGSYTDPGGPDASREMMRFFLNTGSVRAMRR